MNTQTEKHTIVLTVLNRVGVIARITAETVEQLHADVVPSVQQTTSITRTLTCPIAGKAQP